MWDLSVQLTALYELTTMLFTTFILSASSQPNGIVVLAYFVSTYFAVDSVGTKKIDRGFWFFFVSLSF